MLPETASDDGNDATKLLRREDGEERNPLYPGCGAEHVHLSSEVSVRFDHFVDHFGIDVVRVGQDCAVLGERVIYTVIRTTTEYSSKRSFYENIWHTAFLQFLISSAYSLFFFFVILAYLPYP